MRAAIEAYQRLIDAQRNRPSEEEMTAWKRRNERDALNAKIMRRLPKVA